MKAKIIKNKPKFEPIRLEISIESKEELCDLWHRLNMHAVDVKHGKGIKRWGLDTAQDYRMCDSLLDLIDEIVEELGLKK